MHPTTNGYHPNVIKLSRWLSEVEAISIVPTLRRGNADSDAPASRNAGALPDEFPRWSVGTRRILGDIFCVLPKPLTERSRSDFAGFGSAQPTRLPLSQRGSAQPTRLRSANAAPAQPTRLPLSQHGSRSANAAPAQPTRLRSANAASAQGMPETLILACARKALFRPTLVPS